MKKLQFSIEINAPKEKVWDTLWQDENYRKWTSVFIEGSFAESDWKEGGKIHFLTPVFFRPTTNLKPWFYVR